MSRTFTVDLNSAAPVANRVAALRSKIAEDPAEGTIAMGAPTLSRLLSDLEPEAKLEVCVDDTMNAPTRLGSTMRAMGELASGHDGASFLISGADTKALLADIEDTVNPLGAQVEKLEAENAQLKNDLAAATAQIVELKGTISSLQSQPPPAATAIPAAANPSGDDSAGK